MFIFLSGHKKLYLIKCSPFASLGHASDTPYGRKRTGVLPSWHISQGAKPPQIFKLKNIA